MTTIATPEPQPLTGTATVESTTETTKNIVTWITGKEDALKAQLAEAGTQCGLARDRLRELRGREAELSRVVRDTERLGADCT